MVGWEVAGWVIVRWEAAAVVVVRSEGVAALGCGVDVGLGFEVVDSGWEPESLVGKGVVFQEGCDC